MSATANATANDTAASPSGPARGWRRHRASVLIVGFLVLGVLVLVVFGGGTSPRRSAALDPDNPGPTGAQAVARVLADQGVDVTIVRSADALDSVEVDAGTTVVVSSADQLGKSTVQRLRDHASAASLVLLDPSSTVLGAFGIGVDASPVEADGPIDSDCSDPLFDGLSIEVDAARGYDGQTIDDQAIDAQRCFGDASAFALVDADGVRLFGATDALINDQVLRGDNAAVALRLLGQHDRLVWYVPTYDDLVGDDEVGLSSLLPDWIKPGLVIVTLATIVLILWRGRRLGQLSTEPLPVTVKAIETTRSRGRLYRRSGDRGHAAAALRRAARQQAATQLRLGRGIVEDDLVREVARRLGKPDTEVGWLIASTAPAPGSDRELIHLANALAALEEEVRRS